MKVQTLIFTAVSSPHVSVWLAYPQTLAAVIAGCEVAWAFFGGDDVGARVIAWCS